MRTAFLFLLLVNLVFLAWAGWVDVPVAGVALNDARSRLPRLQLASEAPPAAPATRPKAENARKTALAAPPPAKPARCVSVGPFEDLSSTARAAALLHEKGLDPRQRAEQGETLSGYWVYIGGVASETAAAQAVHELAKQGIKDAYVMPETEDGRRISVGLFTDRDRADRRAEAVRQLGMQAEIAERKLPGTVYWVDVRLQPGAEMVQVQDLAAGGSSRIGERPCPSARGAQPAPPAEPAPLERGPPGASTPATTVAEAPKQP